jgi:hypothetical protein
MRAVIEGVGAVAAVVLLFVLWAAIDELRTSSRWRKTNNGAMPGFIVAIYVMLPLVAVGAVWALVIYNVQ